MNWNKINPETKELIKALTISGVLLLIVYFLIRNFSLLKVIFNSTVKALSPFIIGFVFAFLLTPVRDILEKNILNKTNWKEGTQRLVSSLVSIVILLLVFVAFFSILIPQLYSSIQTFSATLPNYIESFNNLLEKLHWNLPGGWDTINKSIQGFVDSLKKWLTLNSAEGIGQLYNSAISFASGILNFFIGIIIAFYILLDGEKLKCQIKKLMYALFPVPFAKKTFQITRMIGYTFNNFISGKALDSLVIGIICYFGCLLLKIPYAPLVSVIVGTTNMIPVFGPFIGGIPVVIMIALINPIRGLILGVFIFVLQQVDGNIIGPRILGSAVGLPSIWVMFAIIVGGALFGIVGMVVGVPLFSVIYVLMRDWIKTTLEEKAEEIKNQD